MKKLLVVVDMQNDFIDGTLGTREAVEIVPSVIEKIHSYEEAGDEVVFTQDTHFDNYPETLEGKHLPVPHCRRGTKGWELQENIAGFAGKRFEKPAFGSVELMDYVGKGEYESIELAGLCTDICVISNAILLKAKMPGTPIFVDASCCAGVTKESHVTALSAMRMCQIEVIGG